MPLTRRHVLTGLLGAAALGGTAGCARGQYLTPEDVISLWYWDRSISDTILGKATAATGVNLKPIKIPRDFKAKLLTSLAGKSYIPDITGFNEDIATYFPDADQFVDLNTLGAKEVESQYLEWKWQRGLTSDGKLIGFPMDTGPTALYYREDAFGAAGLPTDPAAVAEQLGTWESFLAAGEELAAKQTFIMNNVNDIYSQAISQLPDRYMDKNNKLIADGDHVKQAWDLAIDANKRGITARAAGAAPDYNANLQSGKAIANVAAVWWGQILSETAPETAGKWRVTSAPGGPGNNGGSFLGITKSCRNPEAAWEIIKWVQSPANQLDAYNEIALFPAAKEALTSEKVRTPSKFFGNQVINEVFGDAAAKVKPVYLSPYDGFISGAISTELTNVWSTGKDPDQAWKDAQTEVKRQLEHQGVI